MAQHINGPLNWERLGKHGTPMVFVHPVPLDMSCWIYQMAHFSTWYRTLGIDLPGYGKSPTVQPGLTIEEIAEACWETVDAVMPGEPAILVGCSIGSYTVQHMANQRPEQTLAVILTSGGYVEVKAFVQPRIAYYNERGIEGRREHCLYDFSAEFQQTKLGQYFADIFAERNGWADVPTIKETLLALEPPDPDWLHPGIKAPTLIITGSADAGHQHQFVLQERIAGSELAVIDGAGHACNVEQPWAYDAHMIRFLAKHGLFSGESAALEATAAD